MGHGYTIRSFLTIVPEETTNLNYTMQVAIYTDVRRQTLYLTVRKLFWKRSDFSVIISDTAYNSTYVSDVQSLISNSTLQQFFSTR